MNFTENDWDVLKPRSDANRLTYRKRPLSALISSTNLMKPPSSTGFPRKSWMYTSLLHRVSRVVVSEVLLCSLYVCTSSTNVFTFKFFKMRPSTLTSTKVAFGRNTRKSPCEIAPWDGTILDPASQGDEPESVRWRTLRSPPLAGVLDIGTGDSARVREPPFYALASNVRGECLAVAGLECTLPLHPKGA